MIEVRQTIVFAKWQRGLRDVRAVARIEIQIRRLSLGNFGDAKPIGEGLSEIRIKYGPGYRLYLMQRGPVLVVLLCGGDKSSQAADIVRAKMLAKEWTNDS